MSKRILRSIADYIGRFIVSCPSNFTGVWREFMRIRVEINLAKPLKRRMKMKVTRDDWFWINFRYENVPSFCFICGVIGHTERFCSQLFENEEHEIVKPYGAWLRAPLRGQVKPIEAKWLRSGVPEVTSSSIPEISCDQVGRDEANHDPKNTPVYKDTVKVRENRGNLFFQNSNTKEGNKKFGSQLASNKDGLDKETSVVIELKKRRT